MQHPLQTPAEQSLDTVVSFLVPYSLVGPGFRDEFYAKSFRTVDAADTPLARTNPRLEKNELAHRR